MDNPNGRRFKRRLSMLLFQGQIQITLKAKVKKLNMKRNQHNRTRKNPEDYFRYTKSRMTLRRDSYCDILELLTQLPPAKLPDVNVVPSVEEKLMVLTEVYPTIYRFSVIQSVLHIGILTDEDSALIDTCYQYVIDVHYSSDNY